jgi:hypothetical protein
MLSFSKLIATSVEDNLITHPDYNTKCSGRCQDYQPGDSEMLKTMLSFSQMITHSVNGNATYHTVRDNLFKWQGFHSAR